ncbi:DnaD domain-containing protein [Metabacillus indicus]|uniref:DnaD domain-containing protein n=1 Tax=Metabacillus indicus TaxID=246786 RepID=UPI0004935C19|nr:DnaD domain-containing protein [Metabacillus indicus]KEZ50683.1 DNA replication protein DnaD [Metabacillus indicus LMG 22858]
MNKEQFTAMQEQGYLTVPSALISNYFRLGLKEEELVLLLQVNLHLQNGNQFPTPDELSNSMTIQTSACTSLLRSLLQRGFIDIEEYEQASIKYERYSLKPLWGKLYDDLLKKEEVQFDENQEQENVNLYPVFEREFGRPLSPFEVETLSIWMDQDYHDPVIIKAALKEAVISGKLNFRYIDRILFEWKKNGIRTIEQARSYGKRFRQHQVQPQKQPESEEEYKRKVPFYNWLES